VSRRSTRTHVEQDSQVELGNVSQGSSSSSSSSSESHYGSADNETEEYGTDQPRRDHYLPRSYAQPFKIVATAQFMGLGRDLTHIFPSTADDRNKSGKSIASVAL